MNKPLKLRLFGGAVILFNLWLGGHYNIEGVALLIMTFGFAVGYELVVVRAIGKPETVGNASDANSNTGPATDSLKSDTSQSRNGWLDQDTHDGVASRAVRPPSTNRAPTSVAEVRVARPNAAGTAVEERNDAVEARVETTPRSALPRLDNEHEECWATAMAEVEGMNRRPGVWARAFSETDGDEPKAKAAYLKVRVQQLIDASAELTKRNEAAKLVELAEQRAIASDRAAAIESASNLFLQTGQVSTEDLKLMVAHGDLSKLIKLQDRRRGNSLLHICAEVGLDDEVAAMLRAGADSGRSNGNGQLPIHLANNAGIRLQLSQPS